MKLPSSFTESDREVFPVLPYMLVPTATTAPGKRLKWGTYNPVSNIEVKIEGGQVDLLY
jgi:hypothetical protein